MKLPRYCFWPDWLRHVDKLCHIVKQYSTSEYLMIKHKKTNTLTQIHLKTESKYKCFLSKFLSCKIYM